MTTTNQMIATFEKEIGSWPVERCFACDRKLVRVFSATAIDEQTVYVGPECFTKIEKSGVEGHQPVKGGPRLYTIQAKRKLIAKKQADERNEAEEEVIWNNSHFGGQA